MNERDQKARLRAVAQRFVQPYIADPNVQAILLTGSLTRGAVDAVSDVDMSIYYRQRPADGYYAAEQRRASDSGGGVYGFNAEEGLACYFFFDGIKVDTAQMVASDLVTIIDSYLADPAAAQKELHVVMSGVRDGVALHGGGWLQPLQARLRELPRAQAVALVQANLRFPPRAVLYEMGIARGDYPLVHELLVDVAGRLVTLWCALNRQIPPGKVKGIPGTLAGLPLLPPDGSRRLVALFDGRSADGVHELELLIDETITLVEAVMPEVDSRVGRQSLERKLRLEE